MNKGLKRKYTEMYGYRSWKATPTNLYSLVTQTDEPWTTGRRKAKCARDTRMFEWRSDVYGDHEVPKESCTCGFFAYWESGPDKQDVLNYRRSLFDNLEADRWMKIGIDPILGPRAIRLFYGVFYDSTDEAVSYREAVQTVNEAERMQRAAYWNNLYLHGSLAVSGVLRASGNVVMHEYGFRCEYGEIIALSPMPHVNVHIEQCPACAPYAPYLPELLLSLSETYKVPTFSTFDDMYREYPPTNNNEVRPRRGF